MAFPSENAWETRPEEIAASFVSTLADGICFGRGAVPLVDHPMEVVDIVKGFQLRSVFPTRIMSVRPGARHR